MLFKTFQSKYGGAKIAVASWEEFGSPSLDFCGATCFAGLFAGHFAGLSPASFSPASFSLAKNPAIGTKPRTWDCERRPDNL